MKALLRPILVPLLRRDIGEVAERARSFRIESEHGRTLVARLGEAFLGGFNTMLEARNLGQVVDRGLCVATHYRPFFFEGAAMGYLPRSYYSSDSTVRRAEIDLLGLSPKFLYLYYVGLGFWYGVRHAKRPERLLELAPHLDPLYFPLCFDGYGFKVGFFDSPRDPETIERLRRCPKAYRRYAYQGFGRSMFFVHMDDPEGFDALKSKSGPEVGDDLERGRSLALGFTGVDRPAGLLRHLESARDATERGARLTGVSWALAARRMNDREYFDRCLQDAGAARPILAKIPELVDQVLERSRTYDDWQRQTQDVLLDFWGLRGTDGTVLP